MAVHTGAMIFLTTPYHPPPVSHHVTIMTQNNAVMWQFCWRERLNCGVTGAHPQISFVVLQRVENDKRRLMFICQDTYIPKERSNKSEQANNCSKKTSFVAGRENQITTGSLIYPIWLMRQNWAHPFSMLRILLASWWIIITTLR